MATKQKPISITIAPKTILLSFFLVILCLLILRLADVALLIFFSGLFAAALHPSVKWLMHKTKMPKFAAITLIYLIIIVFTVLIIGSVVPAVTEQIDSLSRNLPEYQQDISDALAGSPNIQHVVNDALRNLGQHSDMIVTRLASATLGLVISLFGFITVLLLAAYFLSGGRAMAKRSLHFLPEQKWADRWLLVLEHISDRLGYWLRGQLVVCLSTFVLSYIGLRVLNVPYALTISLLAGLLDVIPTFGAFISGALAVLMALTISPGKAIATGVLWLVIQQVQGNILTPQIMKRALGVPAVTIIISVLVFGKLLGLIGVLLAAPMAAIVAILATEFGPDSRRLWKESQQ